MDLLKRRWLILYPLIMEHFQGLRERRARAREARSRPSSWHNLLIRSHLGVVLSTSSRFYSALLLVARDSQNFATHFVNAISHLHSCEWYNGRECCWTELLLPRYLAGLEWPSGQLGLCTLCVTGPSARRPKQASTGIFSCPSAEMICVPVCGCGRVG